MTKPNTGIIRRASIWALGINHRDVASRVTAMNYFLNRYFDGDISAKAKIKFGFESVDRSALATHFSRGMKTIESAVDALEEGRIDMVVSAIKNTQDVAARTLYFDTVANSYMMRKCQQSGFGYFQLDAPEITKEMDKEFARFPDERFTEKGQAILHKYDEARSQAMLENIRKSIAQDQNSLCVLVTGMGHLSSFEVRTPKTLSSDNIKTKTTSLSLISQQLITETDPEMEYPAYKEKMEKAVEEFMIQRMDLHGDKDREDILAAIKNGKFARFAEDGRPLDDTLRTTFDELLEFLNKKEELVKPEAKALKEKSEEKTK